MIAGFLKKTLDRVNVVTIVAAVVSALALVFFYDPLQGTELVKWDRTFSEASLYGIDIAKRVSHFNVLAIVLFPAAMALFTFVYSYLLENRGKHQRKFFLLSVLLGVIILASHFVRYRFDVNVLRVVVAFALFAQIAYAVWLKKRGVHSLQCDFILPSIFARMWTIKTVKGKFPFFKDVSDNNLRQMFLIALVGVFAFVATAFTKFVVPVLAARSNIYSQNAKAMLADSLTPVILLGLVLTFTAARQKRQSAFDAGYLFAFFLVCTATLSIFLPLKIWPCAIAAFVIAFAVNRYGNKLLLFTCLLAWFPAVFCIYLETLFTLVEKYLLQVNFLIASYVFATLYVVASLGVSAVVKKNTLRETFFYVGALVSLCMLGYLNISYGYSWNSPGYYMVYEMANKLGAVDTVFGGLLPVVDYFSAHALCDVWTGILHGLIHKDVVGILVNPYEGLNLVLASVVLFFLLKKTLNPFAAFLIIAVLPLDTLGLKVYSVCLIALLLQLWLRKEQTFARFSLYWLLIAANAFFIYDEGVSFGMASIGCTVLMLVCEREWKIIRNFILTGVIVGALIGVAYVCYCGITGVDFAARAKEWLAVSIQSNSTWATAAFADPKRFAYTYAYVLLPLFASFAFFFTIAYCLKHRECNVFAALTVMFAFAELLCIARGIVYHNLMYGNGTTGRLLNFSAFTVSFFVLFLISIKTQKKNVLQYAFVLVLAGCLWGSNLLVTFYLPNTSSALFNKSITHSKMLSNIPSELPEQRFTYNAESAKLVGNFKKVFDGILENDETFIDFANMTALYELTGRTKPVYVAQSPSLLTNLYSQGQFFKQLERYKVPVAITGYTDVQYTQVMAWVPLNIRYYQIAEHIYANYKPLLKIGDFILWCHVERFGESLDRAKKLVGGDIQIAENGYEPYSAYHHFNLAMNPYIWANMDNANTNGKIKGHYAVVNIKATNKVTAKITLQNKEDSDSGYGYDFTVLPGINDYKIRVSADYNWFKYDIDSVAVNCDGCVINKLQIVEGD